MEKRLIKLHVILSILLVFIPLILIVASGEVRNSISNYAYSEVSYLFSTLLSIAGTMFIFNGTAYNSRWYNIILGCSLVGVALTPHLDYPVIHYSFASIFFIGSVVVMIAYSSAKQRPLKAYFGIMIILSLLFHFIFNWYSLFWAEWIGILPITIHYLGETTNKLD
ncbi:hypothetical protein [Flavobacterium sp.]|uniref:DUF7103 family protein n=1 Tax=Flavobacterium sp. TaxID=239 RepID=UPI002618473A|nr:hypothetical protein [Flavobacterium sp.]